jgi:PAS domain S-box-containing protein
MMPVLTGEGSELVHESTVLVVDDDPAARDTIEMFLFQEGYDLAFASNGIEALEKAAELTPDLILLDVMMPGLDGFEVCRRLRADPHLAEVPVVMVTALDDRDSRLQSIEVGADDFITKPVDRVELRMRARSVTKLNRYRQLHLERARFERLVEVSPDGLAVVDAQGVIRLANPAMLHILGGSEEDVVGKEIFTFVIPGHIEQCSACLHDAMAETSEVVQLETWFVRTNGERVPVDVRAAYFVWDKESAVQITVHDITERKQAEQDLQRRNLELAARNAVAQALSSSLELRDLLDEALSRTVRALGFVGGLIALIDDRTKDLALFSYISLPRSLVDHLIEAQGLDNTLCDLVCRERRSLSLADLRKDVPVDVSQLLEAGLRSYAGAPIVYQARSLGAFCLLDTTPHPLSQTDHDLLIAIGQQIGIAVENARLFESVAREREVAQTLLDTAQALSTTLQLDKLLEYVLDGLQRVVPYDAASISLLRDEYCWIVASRGFEHGASKGISLAEHPIVHQVVRERAPVTVPDVYAEPDWLPVGGSAHVRSWLGVPMISRDAVIGVLMVDSHELNTYGEESARLAFTFAHQVALAVENSRLYGQTRARLREINLLYDVTTALSSTLDVGQILPYVARALCEILGSTSVEIYSLDEVTNHITVVAEYATSETPEREPRSNQSLTYSLTDLPTASEALVQLRPWQLQADDIQVDAQELAWLETRGAQAMLLLPMVVRGRVLGCAAVWESHSLRRFTEGEIVLGQMLIHPATVAAENARLFAQTQKSARQMQALYETSSALSSSLEEDSLMYTILESVYRNLGCEYVLIATVDDEAGNIGIRHGIWHWEFDAFPEWTQMSQYPLDHPDILADVCRTGRTEIINEWDERFNRDVWDRFGHERLVRIFMPIKVRDRITGVIEVGCDKSKKKYVAEDEVQMLTALADQAGVALENAHLFEETRRRMRELQMLHDVSLAAAAGLRLEDTLQAAAAALATDLVDSRVMLMLVDPQSNTLRVEGSVGYSSDMIDGLRIPVGEGITGWVARHGKSVLVPDVRLDSRCVEADPDVRSEICVPLITGSAVIGVLSIESSRLNAFTRHDERLLSTLASNLAGLVERACLFEEVEEANVRLQELDRLKSQFLANMSHELRTPLNSIIGFSDVLLDGVVGEITPKQRECVQDILFSGEHLLALINDLLDFSKIEAGRMTLEPANFDVADSLAEVQATIRPMIDKKSQVLTIELADDLPPLYADRFRIKQVLINLLSNAHKFTPAGGHITVSCRLADPTTVLFSVTDTGIGIKPEDQEIIFEEFRQADGSATREIQGTGLGLAISRRLVEMHGGRIWVESEYGHGATLLFLLPLAGSQAAEPRVHDETTVPQVTKRC